MVLPNIELYEALKKDVSEESARMIAEVVPQAGDLATKTYVDERLAVLEASLKSYIDSRLLRYTAMIVVPVILTMFTTVIAVLIKL